MTPVSTTGLSSKMPATVTVVVAGRHLEGQLVADLDVVVVGPALARAAPCSSSRSAASPSSMSSSSSPFSDGGVDGRDVLDVAVQRWPARSAPAPPRSTPSTSRHLVADPRREALPDHVADDVVADEVLRDQLVDARLRGVADDRHRAGQREPDHQRRGGGRRTPRVAQRVLAGEVADRAERRGRTTRARPTRNGRLITGLVAATPSRIARTPPPTCQPPCGRSRNRPATRAQRRRRAISATPSTSRRWSDDSGSATSSRSAWTGAIRPVRRAGSQAAAMVTTTPTAYDARKVRGAKISGWPERSSPMEANSARMPIASSTPSPRPMRRAEHAEHERLELHRPGHLPLRGTEGAQQRELAAALGDQDRERVDDQEGADHQGDAGEDQQERGEERDRLQQRRWRLVGGVVAGDRLDAVGQLGRDRVAQLLLGDAVVGGHPEVGVGVLAVEEEGLGGRGVEDRERRAVERAAVGEVRDADQGRAPSRGCGAGGRRPGPCRRRRTRPSRRSGRRARPRPGPAGRVPVDDREALDAVAGGRVGPVDAEAGGADAADQLAVLVDDEDADRADVPVDPGRAVAPARGRRPGWPGWSASTAVPSAVVPPSGRTTTSPTVEAKSAVKLRLSMSEKTSEPQTNATPSTIANVLISRRTLRASRLFQAARNTRQSLASTAVGHPGHHLEDLLAVGVAHLVDDLAVGEEDDAVGVRRGDRVVGDHHDRLAVVVDAAPQQLEHLRAGAGVEVAGRLVGEDDPRPADQRPGHRDPLLLAAAELVGLVLEPVAELHGRDHGVVPLAGRACGPAIASGSRMFSSAVSVGTRL